MNCKIVCLFLVLLIPAATALDYFADPMNFPPGTSRTHLQNITYTGSSLSIMVPSGFTITNHTGGGSVSGQNLSYGSGTNKDISFTLSSPSNCTVGRYLAPIYVSGTKQAEFTFVCIPDTSVVDCKVEYGHGDANYLDELYISDETVTLFNLLRVWNIGHYLSPNEAAVNATAECRYPDFPVRTYGRVEIEHYSSFVKGTFLWSLIESGYWFRIGVVAQEVGGMSVGSTYDVSCDNLTYEFSHHRVRAPVQTCDLEVRSQIPFVFSVTNYSSTKKLYTVTNSESYSICSVYIDRELDGQTDTLYYPYLDVGDQVTFLADANATRNATVHFIPSWYCNSRNPKIYAQTVLASSSNLPPILAFISNQTAVANTLFTYQVIATDPESQSLTYADNSSLFVINPSTGLINVTFNASQVGNYSINITVSDIFSATDSQVFYLEILPPNTAPVITAFTPNGSATIAEGSSQVFTINKTDAENASLTTTWYVNGAVQQTTVDGAPYLQDSFTYATGCSSSGAYTVMVQVSDGVLSDSQSWNLTVTESCSTGGGGGGGGRYRPPVKPLTNVTVECTESWTCTGWSACDGSQQVRNCTDVNACGTIGDRPATERSCTLSCVPNWVCSEWEECVDDLQHRYCTDHNNCGELGPLEVRQCVAVARPEGMSILPQGVYLLVFVLAFANLGLIAWKWHELCKRKYISHLTVLFIANITLAVLSLFLFLFEQRFMEAVPAIVTRAIVLLLGLLFSGYLVWLLYDRFHNHRGVCELDRSRWSAKK
ncbi:hypothetical protein GF342_04900 [Candidatus Woesearchaeota archaeon]|nr:hypothetical protein [Candidatus Woesearchaeota archaeon]